MTRISRNRSTTGWRKISRRPARTLTSPQVFADEATAERARERRRASRTVPSRQAPARTVTTDWPRDLRSETYMHRLWRKWAKGAAIALAVFVALNVALVAASLLPVMLTPPALPALPEAPARVVPGLALSEAPLTAAPALRRRRSVRRRVRGLSRRRRLVRQPRPRRPARRHAHAGGLARDAAVVPASPTASATDCARTVFQPRRRRCRPAALASAGRLRRRQRDRQHARALRAVAGRS